MEDKLYAFIMRGELTKVALEKTEVLSRHSSSDLLSQEYMKSLSLDLLDDECVNSAKIMATVYTAIAAFENMVRKFVVKVLLEHNGENWWEQCVSDKIRKSAESRKNDEEKMKKMQDLYIELIENSEAKKYFEAETKFNIIIADVNKIIGEAIREVMQ